MKDSRAMAMTDYSEEQLLAMKPRELRAIIRAGWTGITHNACQGYGQADMVILPKEYAFDFLLFCNRNPLPCPVLNVTEPGDPHPTIAPEADLRTDVPRYRVFKDGEVIDEPGDILKYWRDDLVGFLIGCVVGTLWVVKAANISWRSFGAYRTTIPCIPAGRFHGPMVVSFRAFKNAHDAVRVVQIYSRHPLFHGAPVHIGDPADIGVRNLGTPDPSIPFQPVAEPPKPGEVVVGGACGITTQIAVMESKIPFMITHCPGHMFVLDQLAGELAAI